ncbi:MAG: hypothetical protein GF398_20265 [Chitinivibrionales bacterium]|nr:hypothetical protein [Chitinivibrionales bacterium]
MSRFSLITATLLCAGILAANAEKADHNHDAHKHHSDKHAMKDADLPVQKSCPVMGGAIDKDVYVDHEGKRVFLCCEPCKAKFTRNPAKYLAKLEKAGVVLETVGASAGPQTTCPVMGGEINKELYVDHNGKRIYLCCEGCRAALEKDPAKFLKKLEEMGQTPKDI